MGAEDRAPWRSRNVWVLSVASLLNDVASEMIMPLLPIFLASLTSSGAAALGLIEGLADLVASALKWQVGRISDRSGKTRPFVISGYAIASSVRPLLSLASAPAHVLIVRLFDRVGKGLRSAPRDALLASSVPPEQRGAAFGFHRSMDHAGAAIGPLVALVILTLWTTDLRILFACALFPGLLAWIVVTFSREIDVSKEEHTDIAANTNVPIPDLWRVLVPIGLATLGTASDSFLMLKAGVTDRAPLVALPVLWVMLHIVRTAAAAPGGWLSDRVDVRGIVSLGWAVRALVFALLALAPDLSWTALAVALYGLSGAAEGAEKKLVAAHASVGAKGAAFGAFHAVVGVSALPASLGFGLLWQGYGPSAAFGAATAVMTSAILALWLLTPRARSGEGLAGRVR